MRRNFRSVDSGVYANAQVNHYVVRDAASFLLKTIRGSAHQADRDIGRKYWDKNNASGEVDLGLSDRSAQIQAEMAALDAASGGAHLNHNRKAGREARERFLSALKDPAAKALFDY